MLHAICELVRRLQCRSGACLPSVAALLLFHVENDAPQLHVITPSNNDVRSHPMTIPRPNPTSDASHGSQYEDTGRLACMVVTCFRFLKSDLSLTTTCPSVSDTWPRGGI